MKLLKQRLLAAIIVFASSLAMVGCDKTNDTPPNQNPDPEPENAVVFPKAQAFYMGDESGAGNSKHLLFLYSEGLTFKKANFEFVGSGECVMLDLNTIKPSDMQNPYIAQGKYTAVDGEAAFTPTTFIRGLKSGINVSGSVLTQIGDGASTEDLIIDGTVTVSHDAYNYKVIVEATTQSGKELVCKFENSLDFINMTITPPIDPFDGVFKGGKLVYFGDFYKTNMGNYLLEMNDFALTERSGVHILGLDINAALAKSQKELTLIPGDYTIDCSEKFDKPMTFNCGVPNGDLGVFGSYWVEQNDKGEVIQLLMVKGGSFTVADKGDGLYKVDATVTLSDGSTRTSTFTGPLPLTDESCLSSHEGNLSLDKFTQGRMIYRGEQEYATKNAYNWAVILATDGINLDNMSGTGDMVQLDINTSKDSKTELQIGSYEVIQKLESQYMVPLSFFPAHFDQEKMQFRGTWYLNDLYFTSAIVNGFIEIKAAPDGAKGYSISFTCRDDYYYSNSGLGNKIEGSHTGELTYVDATAAPQLLAPVGRIAPMDAKASIGVKSKKAARR